MKVCHYLPGDMGGGEYPEIVTNGGMGGGGFQNHFCGDIRFEWPLILTAVLMLSLKPVFWKKSEWYALSPEWQCDVNTKFPK